jgi:hypothetical protein|tara:strand:- start:1279 stop:1404 length:126 start_codon:yes stop_codon:yes gene_type:complete
MKFNINKFTKVFRKLGQLQRQGIRTKKRNEILEKEFNRKGK